MSSNEIRRGSFLVRDQSPTFPFAHWSEATRTTDGRTGFLYSTSLSAAGRADIDWNQLRRHLQVAANHLQPLEAEKVDGQLLLFTPLPNGRSLVDQLKPGQGLSPAQTCKLGIIVSQALSVLHQHSIVHCQVRADRIWISDTGQVTLLRDPGVDPAAQGRPQASDWLQSRDHCQQFAAPELGDPVRPADPSTDVYSLGCLLYRLATGIAPVSGDTWEQAISEHAGHSPPELRTAIKRGADGDPLMRVIAHAMSKCRKARFASADSLTAALRAALPTASESVPPAARDSRAVIDQTLSRSVSGVTDSLRDVGPPFDGTSPLSKTPRRKSRRRQPSWMVAAVSVAVILVLFGVAAMVMRSTPTARPTTTTAEARERSNPPLATSGEPNPTSGVATTDPTTDPTTNGYRLVADETLPYVPPYRPESPIGLSLLPPGPAAIVSFRPATLLIDVDGESWMDVFQPELAGWISTITARSGVSIDAIERCTIALHPAAGDGLDSSLAIELAKPTRQQSLVDQLGVAASQTADGLTIHASDDPDGDAYVFETDPDAGESGSLVLRYAVGSVARMREVADLGGGEINLSRQLRSLWNHASRQSDFAAMCTSNFLFADGRSVLQSSIPQIVDPLKSFLIPDVSAGLLVIQWGEVTTYGELRLLPAGGIDPIALNRKSIEQVEAWPNWADQFLLGSQPDPSWRLLAARLPLMTRFVADQVRVGTSDGAVVGNLYLPRRIVPQLGLAVALALNTEPGSGAVNRGPETGVQLSVEQMLDRPMSVAFDQESLESAIETVIDQFRQTLPPGSNPPNVRIIGSDLQKMGITQNQQIRQFSKTETPLRQVLTDLLLQANPDRTASGPADPKQTLVWVVADDPQSTGTPVILVTTRVASADQYELPKEFRNPQER